MLIKNKKLFDSIEDLSNEIDDMKANGKSIVFTNGCFDILHSGHVHLLVSAASKGDILIVGLNSDQSVKSFKSPNRPINGQYERAHVLAALTCVDCISIFNDDTPEKLIEIIDPDILVKGSDYKNKFIAGADYMIKNKKKVELVDLIAGMSTTNIIEKIKKTS